MLRHQEDEEDEDVDVVPAVGVGADHRPDQQHRGAGRADEARDHRAEGEQRRVGGRRPDQLPTIRMPPATTNSENSRMMNGMYSSSTRVQQRVRRGAGAEQRRRRQRERRASRTRRSCRSDVPRSRPRTAGTARSTSGCPRTGSPRRSRASRRRWQRRRPRRRAAHGEATEEDQDGGQAAHRTRLGRFVPRIHASPGAGRGHDVPAQATNCECGRRTRPSGVRRRSPGDRALGFDCVAASADHTRPTRAAAARARPGPPLVGFASPAARQWISGRGWATLRRCPARPSAFRLPQRRALRCARRVRAGARGGNAVRTGLLLLATRHVGATRAAGPGAARRRVLSTPCRAELKDKKIMVIIGERRPTATSAPSSRTTARITRRSTAACARWASRPTRRRKSASRSRRPRSMPTSATIPTPRSPPRSGSARASCCAG